MNAVSRLDRFATRCSRPQVQARLDSALVRRAGRLQAVGQHMTAGPQINSGGVQ